MAVTKTEDKNIFVFDGREYNIGPLLYIKLINGDVLIATALSDDSFTYSLGNVIAGNEFFHLLALQKDKILYQTFIIYVENYESLVTMYFRHMAEVGILQERVSNN